MNPNLPATPSNHQYNHTLHNKFQHQIKASIDSMYSHSIAESFSLSSSSNKSSSLSSADIEKVLKKSQKIKEMVSSRLIAFVFMSKQSYEPSGFEIGKFELENLKKNLDSTLNECIESEDKTNEVLVKAILNNISELQKKFVRLQKRLIETQAKIKNTEEEEVELKSQMMKVEGNVNRFIIETKDVHSSCNCGLM